MCVFARGQVNVRRGRRKTLFVRPVSLEKAHKFFVILKKVFEKTTLSLITTTMATRPFTYKF